MTTTPRFKVGDRVRWLRGQGKPTGMVLKASKTDLGYNGGRASLIAFSSPIDNTLWLSDVALELVEPEQTGGIT